ncbi:MAG: D-serine deaminase-like pyridoxal phosphate-dependent protein [Cyclobacteriaceae bacterium]|jgi:D-serine deaminase-like pyridoxal phosphate-dependent protein
MSLDIRKPTLLVNEKICRSNILKMAIKARESNVIFRPHFKTHQSATIGEWFREAGVEKITVSSVDMAHYFADHNWSDITIAFPYNPLESASITTLANKIKLNVLIESKESLYHLNKNVEAPVGYFLKIDVGTKRTGISTARFHELPELVKSANPNHQFAGLLAHAGHAYKILDQQQAHLIYKSSLEILNDAQQTIGEKVFLSYGDTPTCTRLESFEGINEIRPGNFVYFDMTQQSYGSCSLDEIAVCMACPIVSIHPERNEAVIYGGAVHLSKDYVQGATSSFGSVVNLSKNGWNTSVEAHLIRLSQEHGIISGPSKYIHSLKIGDLVGVIPAHSCLTADLQGYYLSLTGEKISKLNKCCI